MVANELASRQRVSVRRELGDGASVLAEQPKAGSQVGGQHMQQAAMQSSRVGLSFPGDGVESSAPSQQEPGAPWSPPGPRDPPELGSEQV